MRLNSRTIRHRLVRVDAVVQLLATEVIGEQLADARNARRAAHHHNLVNLRLVQLGVSQKTVKRRNRALEKRVAQTLELGTGDRRLEVLAIRKAIHLDRGLRGGGQITLRLLTCRAQAAKGTRVARKIHLCLLLELCGAVVHQCVIKVLTTKPRVTSRGLHLKDTIVNIKN